MHWGCVCWGSGQHRVSATSAWTDTTRTSARYTASMITELVCNLGGHKMAWSSKVVAWCCFITCASMRCMPNTLLVLVLQVMRLVAQRHRRTQGLPDDAKLLVVQLVDETPVTAHQAEKLSFIGNAQEARRLVVGMNSCFAS